MNKEPTNQNASSQFLKTDGGETKSNAIEIPSTSLPKGGGAIKGIDETFSVNAASGTASLSIPLPSSAARGSSPRLNLLYNSGAGNGVFGLGWSLNLPLIKRKTDKMLPQYLDEIDSDTFLFSNDEDLVPEFKKELDGTFSKDVDGNYVIKESDSLDGNFTIRFYKPRIEGLFARIERWKNKSSQEIKWRVITKENVTTLYGWSNASRIADPKDAERIYEWLPEFIFDDKGNCSQYLYKDEDDTGLDDSLLHNRNRLENGNITYTNKYVEKVLYGNKIPYKTFNDPFPAESDYFFQTIFDYGEYNANAPYDKINSWNFRKDAFSTYNAGFEIRTTRLCKRVLIFHHFTELPGGSALVKSLNFDYDTTTEEDFTFLKSITSYGYIKQHDDTYTNKHLPPLEFTYQKHAWNKDVKTILPEDLVHDPAGLDESTYQFTDLFNEGLPGILTEQGEGWFYKHNLREGKFERAKLISPKPSFSGLGTKLQLMDLDADGTKQLVNFTTDPKGYFELSDDDEWQAFRAFEQLPHIAISDPHTRMIDLNGDSMPELLVTEDHVFTWYESEGRKGFKAARKTAVPLDEEAGPHIVFADPKQTIFLADMSGDRLLDIVRIRNGEVCYWPNLGFGKFGKKVSMDQSPVFDYPDSFNPNLLRLADLDGSGTTDIIYLERNRVRSWTNLCGNSFSTTPFEIDTLPEISNQTKLLVTDLLGTGMGCIVWSSNLSKDANTPLQYIDLMESKKPHLLISYKNNLGKEVSITYTPSTKFYIDDKLAGKPWVTKLYFPVHCISQVETHDMISGHRLVNSYSYHHGYYDHPEKEFRGFGMVEQTDSEDFDHWVKGNSSNVVEQDLHQEPIITKQWFHTGAFLREDTILTQFANEYWYEAMEREGFSVTNHEAPLPDAKIIAASGIDPSFVDHLSPQEWREALRACKNAALRSEIFAHDAPSIGATLDQLKKQLTPYAVASHDYVIELLQPKGQNSHAVFIIKESGVITYNYERNVDDPRISHNLNIKFDEYGNILESAAIVYQRKVADASLPIDIQQAQNKTAIVYTQNHFTNDVIDTDHYRLRMPSEIKIYELKGVDKTGSYYTTSDFITILANATEIGYHQVDTNPSPGSSQKRVIEHTRSIFYKNDLTSALALYQLESKGLLFASYQLAYTPDLLTDIFSAKVNTTHMLEGKFVHSEGDINWWIPSGTRQYKENVETATDAQNRFYSPISQTDPYGAKTKVKYYSNYFLFVEETEDALGNKTSVNTFNFRTLSPQRLKDSNNNISEVITDELGMVKALAVFGKGNEADDLTGLNEFSSSVENTLINDFFQSATSDVLVTHGKDLLLHATARFVYDLDVYKNSGKPAVVASILREEHYQKNNNSPLQLSFEYSNGLGQVVMKKTQAEPGLAKHVTVNPDDSYTVSEVDTATLIPAQLRFIGSGRTVLNNKGSVVKQYEPYFSTSHHFEDVKELIESGVTPLMYYDALGRLVKTIMPDTTFSRVEFDAWRQSNYDPNDTILDSLWYHNRTNRLIDAELLAQGKDPGREKIAADKAAKHANTPTMLHADSQGRPILQREHTKDLADADVYYYTKTTLDIEGNLRTVTDARTNAVMQYKFDMLGHKVYQVSMDSGKRWLLSNILGNPLRTWDERSNEFQYAYDILHRPTQSKILEGDGDTPLDNIFERFFYGETEVNPELKNLRGQVIKHYDTAGFVNTPEYDFKGQPIATTRRLFKKYKDVTNWIDANLITDLETETYTFITQTDALSRITNQTVPDGSVIIPSYNKTGLLNGESVTFTSPAVTTSYIKNIDYNEKKQRTEILYGNDVTTTFSYDKETFRLLRLESKRKNNDPLQDWNYTYDPVGNVTHIEDKDIPTVFFNNAKVTGLSTYTYDALYRLIEATGRENNVPLSYDSKDNWNDTQYMHVLNPGDPMAIRNYTQQYSYDGVGNIQQIVHTAGGNNWTRDYHYVTTNNRLTDTQIGSNTYPYTYHPKHGFMTTMPHLEDIGWNFKEELIKTIRQKRTDGGTPETTYYQYDGGGERVRKITENQADPGHTPDKKEERLSLNGYELYKKLSGTNAGLERTTLNLMDKQHRFAMIETRNDIDDGTEKQLVRYQFHNHLGSSNLELDGTSSAKVISYEEYHPFGTTAYQAKNSAIKSATKRYRYIGMERDDESGLEYHSARYYLSWLGRWINTDPIGIDDGVNVYAYAKNCPVSAKDTNGKQVVAPPPPTSSAQISQGPAAAGGGTLNDDLNRTPKTQTPLEMNPQNPSTGSSVLDSILSAFNSVSRWMRNYLPGIIAAPLAGIVEIIGGLVQLIGGLFTWNGSTGLQGLANMGWGALRIFGLKELLQDQWITGLEARARFGVRELPTGMRLPENVARDMSITSRRTDEVTNNTAGRNGMHAWHASTNAILAARMGPIGSVLLALAGVGHETVDIDSVKSEQYWQGTVNHILDSFTDIIANIFGIIIGLLIPRRWSVYVAALLGNQIPGPGDPDPAFGGAGHPYGAGPGANDPRRAWGHYPPPIGQPNAPAPPP